METESCTQGLGHSPIFKLKFGPALSLRPTVTELRWLHQPTFASTRCGTQLTEHRGSRNVKIEFE